ncbi:hypothetical protein [Mucilaginibacter sp. RCC_168]|uniref:hypothetical protein n=1 Tax=Mucilaginibacter sp. RCC_168 TaxID=3239221 RepID=UPI00352344D4
MEPGDGLPKPTRGNPKDTLMHNRSVDYWLTYTTKTMRANGILPFWWGAVMVLTEKIMWLIAGAW